MAKHSGCGSHISQNISDTLVSEDPSAVLTVQEANPLYLVYVGATG